MCRFSSCVHVRVRLLAWLGLTWLATPQPFTAQSLPSGSYQYRLVATANPGTPNAQTVYGNPEPITIANLPPSVLTNPVVTYPLQNTDATLSGSAQLPVTGPVQVNYVFGPSLNSSSWQSVPAFTGTVTPNTNTSFPAVTVPNLAPGTYYYQTQVQVLNGTQVQTLYGNVVSFTIVAVGGCQVSWVATLTGIDRLRYKELSGGEMARAPTRDAGEKGEEESWIFPGWPLLLLCHPPFS